MCKGTKHSYLTHGWHILLALMLAASKPQMHPRTVVVLKQHHFLSALVETRRLGTLATDAAGQLDVLGHDGHTLGVDGSQVGVLEQAHQVGLSSLLEGQHSAALETQVSLEVLGNLTNQALEGQLPDQQLSALLVLPAVVNKGGGQSSSWLLTSMANPD